MSPALQAWETIKTSTVPYLVPSKNPVEVIESLPRREGQKASMRKYRSGYENYFGMLPVLTHGDPLLDLKVRVSGAVIQTLAKELQDESWIYETVGHHNFEREILGVADPVGDKEGAEILVAKWGIGFTSPVHGHAPGLLHEDILHGQIRVNTYRWIKDGVVRPVRTDIAGRGTLVSAYAKPDSRGKRMGLIHNFTAVEPSASLHYVAEHTRDGRDNGFKVEYFPQINRTHVTQITPDDGRLLKIGDVVLVRSSNVREYGDHFIVITGPLVLKPHGLRPQDVAIHVPDNPLLDSYTPMMGATLLKLNKFSRDLFLAFHGIKVKNNVVTFPEVL